MASDPNVFDVLIVGGGTAGLVMASRLSEDPSLQVLVLEAGLDLSELPEKLAQAILTPAANTQLYETPIDWNLKTVPQGSLLTLTRGEKVNLDGRELRFPQGKTLGGSSAPNGLGFTSGTRAVVDGWAKLGNPGWEWSAFSKSLAQTFDLAKTPFATNPSSHKGPLQVAYSNDCMDEWPKIWANTTEALGFSGAQDTLTSQTPGGLLIPDTVDPAMGIRSYAANTYLSSKNRRRVNLTVRTGVQVNRVIFDKPENHSDADGLAVATGVEFTDPTADATLRAIARREVILSAGAFGSPKILELSGIGDSQRLGIDRTIIDLPGVGENLQNHPMTTISFEVASDAPPTKDAFHRAALRQDLQVLGGPIKEYMEHRTDTFASSGVTSAAQLPLAGMDMPEGSTELEGFLNTTNSVHRGAFALAHEKFVRDILSSRSEASGYYIFGPAYAAMNPDGMSALPPHDGSEDSYITVVLMLAHPLSRGSVHVVAGTNGTMAIDPNYLSHPLDLEVMARHVQFIEQDLVAGEPLAKFLKPNGKRAGGAPEAGALKNLEAAKKFLKDRVVGAHHFTGTCSMIPREMGGVVDSLLRVYGTRNLRVCDASVIPLIPRANPQATVYGVAEHAAKLIKGSLFSIQEVSFTRSM